MALVLGTNCGFVTSRPTADPEGTNNTLDSYAVAFHQTSPANISSISEMGFWCDSVSTVITYEIGIYSDDGANTPLNLLASGTGTVSAGWNFVSVNLSITPNTIYHLCIQVDETDPPVSGNQTPDATRFYNVRTGRTTLPDPFGVPEETGNNLLGIYALYTIPAPATPRNLNVTSPELKYSGYRYKIEELRREGKGRR